MSDEIMRCPRCMYPVLRSDLSKLDYKCPKCGQCVGCDWV